MKKLPESFYPTVTRPYNSWSDKKMATGCKQIEEAMKNNPNFPTTDPTIADYSATVDAYIEQLAKAASKDVNNVAAKNVLRSELISQTITLGNSVTATANGNLPALESSLFPMRKKPQKLVLGKPENLKITNGLNAGELVAKVKSMKAAKSFVFAYGADAGEKDFTWTNANCSTSRCKITGLDSGVKYWIKVGAVGGNGQVVWAEPVLSPYVQG